MPKDLQRLPKLRDSLSFLYIEHAIIEQDELSIKIIRADGQVSVPVAATTVLMLGPGVSITHAAIKTICDNGCSVVWCGQSASRFYAIGMGETRSAENLLLQSKACMDEKLHMEVVRRMYLRRFPDMNCDNMTLQQIRGLEGIRVREAYRQFAKQYGVKWKGRDYKTTEWEAADSINHALSVANNVLYGICQAAVISLGYSTGLGFIHTGKMLSFVYDIADLYKAECTIPAAFYVVGRGFSDLEGEVRGECRKPIKAHRIMRRIPEDIAWVLNIGTDAEQKISLDIGNIWDGELKQIAGGINHASRRDK